MNDETERTARLYTEKAVRWKEEVYRPSKSLSTGKTFISELADEIHS